MAWLRVEQAFRAPVGSNVTIKGWVRTNRESKADGGLCFVAVSDGTCFDPIQCVIRGSIPNFAEVKHLTSGCSVEVHGELVASQGKGQAVEIMVDGAKHGSVRVVGLVENPDTYPVSNKRHTFEYLREVAHLRVRTNTFGAVARVRHCLSMAVHRFFHERGFFYVHTPIITGSDCEGAGQMFRVSTLDLANLPRTPEGNCNFAEDFFGKESHLTVSGQLNVETYCCALSNVYTFGPTFRAENSNTSRHLSEFWMIEPEMAFCDLMRDSEIGEAFIKYLIDAVLTERADDMKFFAERIDKECLTRLTSVLEKPFLRVSYTEAIDILQKSGQTFEFPCTWGSDLQSEHERYLTEKHFKSPVILYNYPRTLKPFYMKVNEDGKTVRAMDVLVPGVGEIIGGSQREERLDVLESRMKEQGLNPEAYEWYLDLRRYGTVPHSGFGLGLERMILFISGMQNIRDVIPFPRTPGSAEF